MKIKFILLSISMLSIQSLLLSQNQSFQIAIEAFNINQVTGLQSFVVGQHDGKWLIIGGRTDGLHRRQPWASFDTAGLNKYLTVIDPINKLKWTSPMSSLPVSIQEQLSSTNMEFYQNQNYLYIIGGYGYSKSSLDHITYPNLTAVKVSNVIDAIINGQSIAPFFRQIIDQEFAVTGGYLNKIYDDYYLSGGQRFDGRYNPMNQPTFTQTYTNAIKRIHIEDDGTTLNVKIVSIKSDPINLHRRDYNVSPQIMPNGEQGLTAFSGVFQTNVNLPYLNCVNIDSSGYTVNNNFSQYYNHYHCAHIPLYSESKNEMHTVFFGGIAQYYDSAGILVQDNNVPFVKTIARVSRNSNGDMSEYKLPIEMPALLGSGSEFIPIEGLAHYENGVLKLDDMTQDSVLLGYIYGGINSSLPNIFFINDGSQSVASNAIFKVYLIKSNSSTIDQLNKQSVTSLQLQVNPNPGKGELFVQFKLSKSTDVQINLYDIKGRQIESVFINDTKIGENSLTLKLKSFQYPGIYFIELKSDAQSVTQKIIINP